MRRDLLALRAKQRVDDFLQTTLDNAKQSMDESSSPKSFIINSPKSKGGDTLIPLLMYGHLNN